MKDGFPVLVYGAGSCWIMLISCIKGKVKKKQKQRSIFAEKIVFTKKKQGKTTWRVVSVRQNNRNL